jgi:hypothetical protein
LPEKNFYSEITGIQMTEDVFEKIMASILFLKNLPIEGEFRTTFIPGIRNQTTIEVIQQLVGNGKAYSINQFREGNTVTNNLVQR